MKKFAVFDIDGTLYRWQLYHELVQMLALQGVFPDQTYTQLDQQWNKWRGGEVSFDDYESYVIQTMVENLPTIPIQAFETACDTIIEQSAHKTHHFPRALLKDLRGQDYTIIAITGSQQELIERFAKHYDIDIAIGATYERKKDRFTGAITRPTIGHKPEILQALVREYKLTWDSSLAIGDSDGDITLLQLVQRPIAFNPSAGLFKHAEKHNWPIVIERKNIAYRLEGGADGLVLAETIIY